LTQVVIAAAMSFSVPVLAQESKCPPGAWFCAEAEVTVPPQLPQAPQSPNAPRVVLPPQVAPEEVQVAPQPPIRRRPPPPQFAPAPPPGAPPPPVVIYQPPLSAQPPQVIIITPGYGYGYGGYPYARPRPPQIAAPPPLPPPAAPRWQSEFGVNLRLEGVALGKPAGAAFNSGLGGVGMSLRYRPAPGFAFDLGVDALAGTDFNGFQRTETPFSLSGILFLNPRSRAQFYLQGGANLSHAQVRSDLPSPLLAPVEGGLYGATYNYFGGQGGGGFEFRMSRRVALDLDAIGFVRERIGDIQQPEFIDKTTGRTTNVSDGALFRGGLTFWW
jgi:hypothetical protein